MENNQEQWVNPYILMRVGQLIWLSELSSFVEDHYDEIQIRNGMWYFSCEVNYLRVCGCARWSVLVDFSSRWTGMLSVVAGFVRDNLYSLANWSQKANKSKVVHFVMVKQMSILGHRLNCPNNCFGTMDTDFAVHLIEVNRPQSWNLLYGNMLNKCGRMLIVLARKC